MQVVKVCLCLFLCLFSFHLFLVTVLAWQLTYWLHFLPWCQPPIKSACHFIHVFIPIANKNIEEVKGKDRALGLGVALFMKTDTHRHVSIPGRRASLATLENPFPDPHTPPIHWRHLLCNHESTSAFGWQSLDASNSSIFSNIWNR